MKSESIVDVINRRFVSGNSVPVERAHINAAEWAEIKAGLAARQAPASGEVEPVAFAAVNGADKESVAGLFQDEKLAELGAQRIGGDVRPLVYGDTHPPAKVPEGQVMVPREFLAEYYDLVTDSDFTALHKLVRKNAISALLTTPTPEMEWVKCSERLPTEADADFQGHVWYHPVGWDDGLGPVLDTWHFVVAHAKICKTMVWTTTGFKKPTPPQEQ